MRFLSKLLLVFKTGVPASLFGLGRIDMRGRRFFAMFMRAETIMKIQVPLAALLMAVNSASGVVAINSAGEFSYNYNAASGPIPEEAENNNLSIQAGVPGLSNTVANTEQSITWHFALAPGLVFGGDFEIQAGGVAQDGVLTGQYSTTGLEGSYKDFFTNDHAGDKPCVKLAIPDIAGATNLYVRFAATTENLRGSITSLFWGDHPTDRIFKLSGTVEGPPDPAAAGNSAQAIETKVAKVFDRMTLEEKVRLCVGSGGMDIGGVPRLKIPAMKCSDGPRGPHVAGMTAFPAGPGQSAAWNPALMEAMGRVWAMEARSEKIRILLGPGINILRDPLGGRWFEYYSEDPYLTGALTVPVVRAVQSNGVAVCLKHFAANNREENRNEYMSMVDERPLQEIYLPAFRMGVDAGAWAVMTAANGVNGDYASDSRHLLGDILKDGWGFDGLVMTDWLGTRSCEKAALAGLDVSMPGTADEQKYLKHLFGGTLLEAVKSGRVPVSVVEDKAKRVLRVHARLGLLDRTAKTTSGVNTKEHHDIAREMAEESMVLLKNDPPLLPLDRKTVKKVLVLGPNADRRFCLLGLGGSSWMASPYEITALAGIRQAAGGGVDVEYLDTSELMGFRPITAGDLAPGENGGSGFNASYFKQGGTEPALSRNEEKIDFLWEMRSPDVDLLGTDHFRATFTGRLLPKVTGFYTLRISANDGAGIYTDPVGGAPLAVCDSANSATAEIFMEAGKPVFIRVDYTEVEGDAFCRLEWAPPSNGDSAALAKVAARAKAADAVVFVGGLDHGVDTEGRDRPSLAFPTAQTRLILELAKANPRLAVVLINGSPLELGEWIGRVPSVVEAWYGGMEAGTAIGKILFGDVNPSGKLPFTWPQTLAESPAHAVGKQDKARIDYKEGLYVGYRYYDKNKITPQFPFGFGLSYTTFAYEKLEVVPGTEKDFPYIANVTLRNTGKVAGKEVVQIYSHDEASSVEQPVKELAGFAKVELKPGESKTVSIPLYWTAFQYYDPAKKAWVAEPGKFVIFAGASATELKLQQIVTMQKTP